MTTTIPQHRRALALANETRYFIADCRRSLREAPSAQEARNRAAALIEENPPELRNLAVYDLLMSCRKHGRTRVLAVLRRAGVSEARTFGELTDRQRGALVGVLRG